MRFHGAVGYGKDKETPLNSGVWVKVITEVSYFGDVVRNNLRQESGANLNNDLSVNNSISIVADEYADKHFSEILYVSWQDVLWTVTSVEVRPPRLILNIGSVYNGPTP